MTRINILVRASLVLLFLLVTMCAIAQVPFPQTTGVPTIIDAHQTSFQQQTHFLTFIGSFKPESAQSAAAYYDAIDPNRSKRTFQSWLVNAGFIQDPSEWNPTGPQTVIHDPSQHGYAKILADAHVIVLNAADLGFVRNQFIRCVPSCTAKNPKVYTYLENYPVNAFADSHAGRSGFPINTGYPTQAEATLAIQSALQRPVGPYAGCSTGDTFLGCGTQRIADVAFEWAPPENSPNSSTRYGTTWAFVFSIDGSGNVNETISVPPPGFSPALAGKPIPNFANPRDNTLTIGPNDPFPPNLDFRGFKQHPGVCFICHGGQPATLTTTGAYPNGGNVNGFRFLPLDNRNLFFSSDGGASCDRSNPSTDLTSRACQEPDIKIYNQAVLLTVSQAKENDGTGTIRQAHLAEVIKGWYASFEGDQTMSRATQFSDFIPVGWRESLGAPPGSERLYREVVGPSCRSCHFNRELSLDFGTYKNFKQESDLQQLALLPFCNSFDPFYKVDPKLRPMPLALLTFQRFWEANTSTGKTLADGTLISNTGDQLAKYFGYNGVAGYCATNP